MSQTDPYGYQVEIAKKIDRDFDGRALVALGMGTGKSLISLLYALRNPDIRPILIICPASAKLNWRNEVRKHTTMKTVVLEGRKMRPILNEQKITIINYDIFRDWLPALVELNPQLVIIDEVHYLQDQRTQRTRAIRKFCSKQKIPHILALSGTPFVNRVAELFPTLNIVRPDIYNSFVTFGDEYCQRRKKPWGWEYKGAKNLDKLHRVLKEDLMIRKRKEDLLKDLPEKTRIIVPADLSDAKEYDGALNNFQTWMRKNNPTKMHSSQKAEQLTQLTYLKMLVGQLKFNFVVNWIDNFLEESEGKLVLFAIHREFIKKVHEKYKSISVVVNGEVNSHDRQAAIDRFQKNKNTRLFIGNIKSAGVAINLTSASTIAFAEIGWTPGEHTQAEDRIHRIGQLKKTFIYYLIASNTIESKLLKLIQRKQKIMEAVLDGHKHIRDFNIHDQLAEALK